MGSSSSSTLIHSETFNLVTLNLKKKIETEGKIAPYNGMYAQETRTRKGADG